MTKPVAIYFCEPAPVSRALWLKRLLEPVAAACLINSPAPLEVRATGRAGGYAQSSKYAPDGRVCISSKIVFAHAETILYVWLHEQVHRMLGGRQVDDHGAEFFCLLAVLLKRASGFFELDSWFKLDLYDLQDWPAGLEDDEDWRGTVLNWSLQAAAELVSTDTTAEDLTDVVCARWHSFLIERERSATAAANAVAIAVLAAKRQTELVVDLKHSRTLWRCLGGLGWLMFMVLTWLNVRGFQ